MIEGESKGLSLAEIIPRMAGAKQIDMLRTPRWDSAQEHLQESLAIFKKNTLHFSMSLNWTAAVGIATQSPIIEREALTLLEQNKDTALLFGHQSTIHRLLSITPALKLNPEVHSQWLRFAMYFNAARDE